MNFDIILIYFWYTFDIILLYFCIKFLSFFEFLILNFWISELEFLCSRIAPGGAPGTEIKPCVLQGFRKMGRSRLAPGAPGIRKSENQKIGKSENRRIRQYEFLICFIFIFWFSEFLICFIFYFLIFWIFVSGDFWRNPN